MTASAPKHEAKVSELASRHRRKPETDDHEAGNKPQPATHVSQRYRHSCLRSASGARLAQSADRTTRQLARRGTSCGRVPGPPGAAGPMTPPSHLTEGLGTPLKASTTAQPCCRAIGTIVMACDAGRGRQWHITYHPAWYGGCRSEVGKRVGCGKTCTAGLPVDADGAHVNAPVDLLDHHVLAEGGRVDHQAVAQVQTDVADVGVEEHQVTGLELVT